MLVMFAFLLVPLLLVAGLSVDVGLWYNKAADMRKAADAAALAGVVWLPNEGAAQTAALQAAARNGFSNGGTVTVTVGTSTVSNRRIKVTITDTSVGSFFYENLGGRRIPLSRTSFAEYVLPVPMGSPRNFIGTGLLQSAASTGIPNEELYMSINPYCTAKENGDRHQTGYVNTCSGSRNGEYRPNGYETYIEVPENAPASIDVLIYDGRYNEDEYNTGVITSNTCVWTYPGNWIEVPANTAPRRLDGPAQYQTYSGGWSGSWSGTTTLQPNYYYNFSNTTRYRYKLGVQNCTPSYRMEAPIDDFRQDGEETYTFSLFAADSTPLNDSDNPLICTATYEHDTPFDYGPYLTSYRWNKLCTIPAGATAGRYILRSRNGGAITNPEGDGSNQYGVVARYTNASGHGLCDGRTDATCPRVFGKESLSVRAASSATTAQFFLAEIAPEHVGKTLRLELFDPGEGGQNIKILRPTGANSWTPATFKWVSPGVSGSPSGSVTSVDVTGNPGRFNGRLLTIDVSLAGYSPPSNNHWWKIEYVFSGNAVTDRTTWAASVLGDPIHLVEEF